MACDHCVRAYVSTDCACSWRTFGSLAQDRQNWPETDGMQGVSWDTNWTWTPSCKSQKCIWRLGGPRPPRPARPLSVSRRSVCPWVPSRSAGRRPTETLSGHSLLAIFWGLLACGNQVDWLSILWAPAHYLGGPWVGWTSRRSCAAGSSRRGSSVGQPWLISVDCCSLTCSFVF